MGSGSVVIEECSTYRTAIMGMAILFIMGYHSGVIWQGRFGVEMFLIMSGIGISFSLSKKTPLLEFYKKRVKRILPCFILCGSLFYLLVKHYVFIDYLQAITTYSFWVDGVKWAWFIPVIFVYYLISPFVSKLSVDQILIMGGGLILLLLLFNEYLPKSIGIMLRRLPSFLFGLAIGKIIMSDRKKISQFEFKSYIGVLLFLAGYFILIVLRFLDLSNNAYLIIPYLFLAFGLSLITVLMCKHQNLFRRVLELFGTVSLELYMIHEFFFLIPLRPFITNNYVMFLLTVPIACYVALLIHKAICLFFDKIFKTLKV